MSAPEDKPPTEPESKPKVFDPGPTLVPKGVRHGRFGLGPTILALILIACAIAGGVGWKKGWFRRAAKPTQKVAQTGTDRPWQKAADSPMHTAHAKANPPVQCKECHVIEEDVFHKPGPERCTACHEEIKLTLHTSASLKGKEEGQCITCHTFLVKPEAEASPWACLRCHASPQGDRPAIVIHGKEECSKCHRPHGKPSGPLPACTGCHQHEMRRGMRHGNKPEDALMCVECHSPHRPAKTAEARCAQCHAEQKPTIPDTALFAGHDRCVQCHQPHDWTKALVVPCRSCHRAQRVLGDDKVAQHSDCRSCHNQHAVKASPSSACANCHAKIQPSHPSTGPGSGCTGCHDIHNPNHARVQACSTCHKTAGRDDGFHPGGTKCVNCHTQHEFAPPKCSKCHQAQTTAVAANKGHGECKKCHTAHKPQRPACASCHQLQATSGGKGHKECKKCHDAHSGSRLANAAVCTSCHQNRANAMHGKLPGGCAQCHGKPHAPGGLLKKGECTSCHEPGRLPSLHEVPKHRDCRVCHGSVHGKRVPEAAVCRRCHTDRRDHEPNATRCIGCHVFGGAR